MIATLLLLMWAFLGGLWRRVFGGFLSQKRILTYVYMAPLTIPLTLLYPIEEWYWRLLVGIATYAVVLLFFVVSIYPGGKFTDDRDVMLKYGPFGIGYILAHKYWKDEWNETFNKPWYPITDNKFIDGSNAVGEISLGALFFAAVGSTWFWIL
jgi:hypothetical protein